MPRVLNKHRDVIPKGAVYCGRPSPWGNPFIIGKHGDRDTVCDRFEREILPTLDVSELRGKALSAIARLSAATAMRSCAKPMMIICSKREESKMSTIITIAKSTGGIKPAPEYHCELLNEMELVCKDLVRLFELERTGVRDGRGEWLVSGPILDRTKRLAGLAEQHRVITTGK